MIRVTLTMTICCTFFIQCATLVAAQTHHVRSHHASPAWSDPSVDVGTVRQTTALLSAPDAASVPLTRLKTGDWTVLVSRTPKKGWISAIALTSGRQGWVKADRLSIRYTRHPNPSVSLDGGNTGGELPPILTVQNRTSQMVFLHIDQNPEVSINPGSDQVVTVSAGLWGFNASSPGIIPLFGNHAFVKGDHYSWDFYIRPHVQTATVHAIDPRQREELKRRQVELDTMEADVKVQQELIDSLKVGLKTEEDKVEADLNGLKTTETTLDHTNQAAVDSYNQQVDTVNAELDTCKQDEANFNGKVVAFNSLLDACRLKRSQLEQFANAVNSSK